MKKSIKTTISLNSGKIGSFSYPIESEDDRYFNLAFGSEYIKLFKPDFLRMKAAGTANIIIEEPTVNNPAYILSISNNGAKLARDMHFYNELKDGMTQAEIEDKASLLSQKAPEVRFMETDDFWEDFFYEAGELGYTFKI